MFIALHTYHNTYITQINYHLIQGFFLLYMTDLQYSTFKLFKNSQKIVFKQFGTCVTHVTRSLFSIIVFLPLFREIVVIKSLKVTHVLVIKIQTHIY